MAWSQMVEGPEMEKSFVRISSVAAPKPANCAVTVPLPMPVLVMITDVLVGSDNKKLPVTLQVTGMLVGFSNVAVE